MRKILSNLAFVLLCFAACSCSGGSDAVDWINIEVEKYLDQKRVELKAAGEIKRIRVSGPAWEALSSTTGKDDDWLKVSQDAATGELVIEAQKNFSSKARTATVTVKVIDGEASEDLYVTQKKGSMPEGALQMEEDSAYPLLKKEEKGVIEVPSIAGSYKLKVDIAKEIKDFNPAEAFKWFVEIGEDVDWITSEQSEPQSVKRNSLALDIKKNTEIGWYDSKGDYVETMPRTAIVYVVCEYAKSKNARAVYELTIKQQHATYIQNPGLDDVTDWTEE